MNKDMDTKSIMNELFSITRYGERCKTDKFEVARNNILQSQDSIYKEILSNLAIKQKLVLQAIAKEKEASKITSSAFIKKYNLPSASSVQSAIKGLMEKDLITQTNGIYHIYDYFFAIGWQTNTDTTINKYTFQY